MWSRRRRPAQWQTLLRRSPLWKSPLAVVALLSLTVLWVAPMGAQTGPGGQGTQAVKEPSEVAASPAADHQLLDDLYSRHHISSKIPEPGFVQYLQDVGNTVGESVASWLSVRLDGLAGSTSQLLVYVGYALLGGLAAVCLWLGVRYLMQYFQQPSNASRGAGTLRAIGVEEGIPVATGSWEAALQQALADGDVGRAVHALWWWLAQSLGCGADPSWTSRELMQRSGRRDLRAHVRRLDRLLYSPNAPRLDDVEALWRDLQPLVQPLVTSGSPSQGNGAL